MRSAVIVFPGSNREHDIADAIERASGTRPSLIWHKDSELPPLDLIVLPGGFAYGDYLRTGAIAARAPVMREVARRAEAGTPVIGVCNGFPGAVRGRAAARRPAVQRQPRIRLPRRVPARRDQPEPVHAALRHRLSPARAHRASRRQLLCRPRDARPARGRGPGGIPLLYPGTAPSTWRRIRTARRDIAGVFDRTKTVLGLMPHPENATDPLLVGAGGGSTDGQGLFRGIVDALA